MKATQLIRLAIPLFFAIACGSRDAGQKENGAVPNKAAIAKIDTSKDTFQTETIIPLVFCKTDPTQSYALYIPAQSDSDLAMPVVYFFDPHGDGSLPLTKYKTLADNYHFILVGSNNSKNGNDWTTADNIWNNLYHDSKNRLKINTDRIYTCGFSGGAKVATYIGLTHGEIKGVIANGAGLADMTENQGHFNFSFTAVAGEGDMNMTDLVSIDSDLDKTQTRHRIIFFDGKHEWAPEATMNIGFAGWQLDAMRQNSTPRDDRFINNFVAGSKQRIASYLNKKNFTRAEADCKVSINLLDGLSNETNWFKEKDASIKNNPLYKQQRETEEKLLVSEEQIKAAFMQKFQQPGMDYWIQTIKDVQARAKEPTATGAMYQRLQAYLSLAFYSFSNQLITANRNDDAQYFVDLYKMADPTNSEAWYFSAILNARRNDAAAAKADLSKAVQYGFNDGLRLTAQPEFQKINLTEIEGKLKP